MIRKEFLSNPNYPSYFIYGGLLLIFLTTPVAVYDIATTGSFLSGMMIGLGTLFIVAGFLMRFYQAKQNGSLTSFFFSLGFAVVVFIVLMAAKVIHTPAYFQDIF
jgi:hypothetical protein